MDRRFMPIGRDESAGITAENYGRLADYAKYRSQQRPNRAVRRQAAKLAKQQKRK